MMRKYDENGNPVDSDSDLVNSFLKDKYFTGDLSDENLAAQRDVGDNRRMLAGIGEGAATIAGGLTGTKPDSEFYGKLAANSDRGVKDIETRRKSKMDEAKFAQDAQKFGMDEDKFQRERRLQDPDSPESRVFQNALRAMQTSLPPAQRLSDDQLTKITASDKDRIMGPLQLQETANTRLQQQKMVADERHAKMETPIGRANNEKDASDVKEALATYENLKQGIKKMQSMREEYGNEVLNRTAINEGKATAAALQTEYKKLMSLRGMGEPSQEFLDKIIPSNPLEVELGHGTEAKMQSFSNSLDDHLQNIARSRGLDASKATSKYKSAEGFPRQVRKAGKMATVGSQHELDEAKGEGWQ